MHVCVPIKICQDLLTSCLLLANMGKMSMDLLQRNSAERYNILFNTFSSSACIGISYRIERKNFDLCNSGQEYGIEGIGWVGNRI